MAGDATAVVTTVTKLNGFFKNKYAPKLKDIIPDVAKVAGRIPFSKAERIGSKYVQPVELALPQGATYAAAGDGAFDLEDAYAGEMQPAELNGNQFVFRDTLDYESAAKAVSEGEEAYGSAAGRLVKRLTKATYKRLELSFWYGASNNGLGAVGSIATVAAGGVVVLQMSTASWAPGIWTGMKNMGVDVYGLTGGVPTTKRTATTVARISKVDIKNKRLTLTGTQADLAAIVATDVIVPRGAWGKEMVGIDRICSYDGTSGTLFGIDGGQYELWTSNVYAAGGAALTLSKLDDAICDAVGKGLEEDVTVFVSVRTWKDLVKEYNNLRRFSEKAGTSKLAQGTKAIELYSQNGRMTIEPHTVIKEGEAFAIPLSHFKKVGATDVTFNVPDRGDEFFRHMESKAGYELRCYANLALLCTAPAFCTKITGIVNS